jgi:trehalose 6-phosphate phosphatase
MRLPEEPGWALFLDLDGTLCDYRDDPADVALSPLLRGVLSLLATRLRGAVCVLSGRSATDLDRILGALKLPRIAEHGGAGAALRDHDYRAQLAAVEVALGKICADNPGTWVERKPSSCVLHYRHAPERAERLRSALLPLLSRHDRLRLLDGVYVFEFTARDRDKGTALFGQMQLPPFAGRQPVVVGDDVTDEDAFVAALALGGFGIGVGTRTSLAAKFHLDDYAAVGAWLAGLAGGEHAAH